MIFVCFITSQVHDVDDQENWVPNQGNAPSPIEPGFRQFTNFGPIPERLPIQEVGDGDLVVEEQTPR